MPKIGKKKARVLAQEARAGELTAEVEHLAKTFTNKKQLKIWVMERVKELIDKIDPLKLVVIVLMTYFIKQGIEWSEEFVKAIREKGKGTTAFSFTWVTAYVWEAMGIKDKPQDLPPEELVQWGFSFIVAYLMVEHGGEIITAGGNILGVAKGLMGMLGT